MNRDDVDELFALFIAAEPEQRTDLLATVDSAEIREELRRLLDSHDLLATDPHFAGFLESLDLELASWLVDPDEPAPTHLGRFEVIRQIARGASGTVFLARDPDLGRELAVKLLASDLNTSPSAVRRFREEARAASRLDHPNVVTIFEAGAADDGRLYIAMAYHDGETLRDRIRRSPLTLEESLLIAGQIADGLAAAHASGIVHRDIKPENILLTSHGARIVDFGIAKALHDQPTLTGATTGTAAYMSPEQTRGNKIDHRTDIWSLGVVLYEMLVGERPFRADSGDALVYSIRNDPSAPIGAVDPAIPDHVLRLIDRCLAKEPDQRFQSAEKLRRALSGSESPPVRIRRQILLAAVGAVALSLSAWWLWIRAPHPTPPGQAPARGVAVLPWQVAGNDVEYLREGGLATLLAYSVDGIEGLRRIDPSTVIASWHQAGEPVDDEGRLRLARRLGARYLITGNVVQSGSDRITMIAEVRDTARGRRPGSAQVAGPADSVSSLVDQLTIELLRKDLLPTIGTGQPAALRTITTSSLPALKAFLVGENEYRLANWQEAGRHYLAALEQDSTFARALYRLIKTNDWGAALGNTYDYLKRLEPLIGGLPERDRMLILGDMASRFPHAPHADQMPQILMLEELLRRHPDEVEAWVALGDRYFHDRGRLLLPPEGFRHAFRQAIALNPYSRQYSEPYLHLIEDAFFQLDSVEAQRLIAQLSGFGRDRKPCLLQLIHDLAWGTEAAQRHARMALDTLLPTAIWTECIPRTLGPIPYPKPVRDRFAASFRSIADTAHSMESHFTTFNGLRLRTAAARGEFASIRKDLADLYGQTGPQSWWAERLQIILYLLEVGDSTEAHRAARRLEATPLLLPGLRLTSLGWLGLFAAKEGRWTDLERAIQSIDSLEKLGTELPHPQLALAARTHAAALRAYAALARGDHSQLAAMDSSLRQLNSLSVIGPEVGLRHMVGKLLLERGELRDAERYFNSFGPIDFHATRTRFQLGRIAELEGRREDAIRYYRQFVYWWDEADQEYQGLVNEARAGLSRLGVTAP